MGRLIYSSITSLDGYVADATGNFDWAAPDEEVHAFVNDVERTSGTFLLGRRMYEALATWDTMPLVGEPDAIRDFAGIWRGADKVVYSRTLAAPIAAARTRIERDFDAEAVRSMKAAADRGLSVGGPDLAAQAIRAGLVDELHWFAFPVVVGGGTHWLPDGLGIDLDLLDTHRFANGAVYLRYRVS